MSRGNSRSMSITGVIPRGHGPRGLTNHELDALARKKRLKGYAGCLMDDELSRLGKPVKVCGIANFQDSDEAGSHWVAWYVAPDVGYACYYDPLGFPPTEKMRAYLEKSGKPIAYNPYEIQTDEWSCGLHALEFLVRMQKGGLYSAYYE